MDELCAALMDRDVPETVEVVCMVNVVAMEKSEAVGEGGQPKELAESRL